MAARRRPPRNFLYLDHEVAKSYLSDLLGWLPEEASSTDLSSDNKHKDWSLGYRGTGYSRGSGEEFSSEDMKRFRYTPESLFDHLYRELDREVDGERMLMHLQSLDEEGWKQLPNGAIVEITGTVKMPDVVKVIGAMRGLGNLMPLIESLEETGELHMNQQDRLMMNGLKMVSELGESTQSQNAAAIVVELVGSPGYRFVASLKKNFLRTGPEDLEGEAKVLGRMLRKVNKGDAPIGLEQLIPGFEAFRGLQGLGRETQPEDDSIAIGYPAATLTPIAIYQ